MKVYDALEGILEGNSLQVHSAVISTQTPKKTKKPCNRAFWYRIAKIASV